MYKNIFNITEILENIIVFIPYKNLFMLKCVNRRFSELCEKQIVKCEIDKIIKNKKELAESGKKLVENTNFLINEEFQEEFQNNLDLFFRINNANNNTNDYAMIYFITDKKKHL